MPFDHVADLTSAMVRERVAVLGKDPVQARPAKNTIPDFESVGGMEPNPAIALPPQVEARSSQS
jgi:hypothetical protein